MKKLCKKDMCIFDELRNQNNNFENFFDENKIEDLANPVRNILELDGKVFEIATALKKTGFSIYMTDMERDLSGMIGCDEKLKETYESKRVILINKNESMEHQRFTMAHELAHYIFDYKGETFYSAYRLSASKLLKNNKEEKRANRFAAALLMPKDYFINSFKSLKSLNYSLDQSISMLSKEYCVPKTAVGLRIEELSL